MNTFLIILLIVLWLGCVAAVYGIMHFAGKANEAGEKLEKIRKYMHQ